MTKPFMRANRVVIVIEENKFRLQTYKKMGDDFAVFYPETNN